MKDGFLKVAAATPRIRVADCAYNASRIEAMAAEAAEQGTALLVFPELCVTAYTCGDLFLQETLLHGAEMRLPVFWQPLPAMRWLWLLGCRSSSKAGFIMLQQSCAAANY